MLPNGFFLDEGNIWHAIYEEGRVLINPEGEITGKMKLPTINVTSVEFTRTSLFIATLWLVYCSSIGF